MIKNRLSFTRLTIAAKLWKTCTYVLSFESMIIFIDDINLFFLKKWNLYRIKTNVRTWWKDAVFCLFKPYIKEIIKEAAMIFFVILHIHVNVYPIEKYWLIEYCSSSRSRTAHSYREVTIVGERVQNLDLYSVLTVVEQGGIFVVPMGAEALFLPTSPQDLRRTVYWKASVCEEKRNLGKVVTLSV